MLPGGSGLQDSVTVLTAGIRWCWGALRSGSGSIALRRRSGVPEPREAPPTGAPGAAFFCHFFLLGVLTLIPTQQSAFHSGSSQSVAKTAGDWSFAASQ